MATYGTCECSECYVRVPKNQAYKISVEKETGRSGGGWRYYSGGRSNYSTGRTYYSKKEVWLCSACYAAYKKRQRTGTAFAAVVFIGGALWLLSSAGDKSPTPNHASPSASSDSKGAAKPTALPRPLTQTSNVALETYRAVEQPEPRGSQQLNSINRELSDIENVVRIQTRLVELGYLVGPADGVWGPKSRAALKAFKASNGLSADEKWDAITENKLFASSAFRAPMVLSPAITSR